MSVRAVALWVVRLLVAVAGGAVGALLVQAVKTL